MGDAITKADGPILGIIEGVLVPVVEFDISVKQESQKLHTQSTQSIPANTSSSVSATIISRRKLSETPTKTASLPDLWLITETKKIRLTQPFISLYDRHGDGTHKIDVKASGIQTASR